MKIGIFTALFHDKPFEEALDLIAAAGIESVELGGGAYPGSAHLDQYGGPAALVTDDVARKKLVDAVASRGLIISAISVHGNPLQNSCIKMASCLKRRLMAFQVVQEILHAAKCQTG